MGTRLLGQNPRGTTSSFLNEEAFADLGAIQDQADPESVFHFHHAASAEARRAYVQLDTSKRVPAHSLRPANDSGALARAILNGEEITPSEVIGEDQRFVDARLPGREAPEDAVPTIPEDEEGQPCRHSDTNCFRR